MNLFILSTSISDVLAGIVAIIVFFILILGMPILISRIFNVKIVSRTGTTIAEPHYAKNIVNNLSDLRKDTITAILKKINIYNKRDHELLSNHVSDKLTKLIKLNDLKEKGVITQDEFEILKSEIIK
jgi:hypothetical protein